MNNAKKVWEESMAFEDDLFEPLEFNASELEHNANAKKHQKKIGSFVLFRRVQLGLGQEKLASLCGITLEDLQNLENNNNDIKLSELLLIFEILDIKYTLYT